MITNETRNLAVKIINEYLDIHKGMEELEEQIERINKIKEGLTDRLNKTREEEKELISKLSLISKEPFVLSEFIKTL